MQYALLLIHQYFLSENWIHYCHCGTSIFLYYHNYNMATNTSWKFQFCFELSWKRWCHLLWLWLFHWRLWQCQLWSFKFRDTQVGSPAVRLRLAHCTAWVKRWSEAMDFLQSIFKTNIFLSRIFKKMYGKCKHISK